MDDEPVHQLSQRHLQRGQQLLTMIVSLEAIFLSTFVTISQNRADEKTPSDSGPAVANSPGRGATNETLLRLSNEILALTKEIHAASTAAMPVSPMGEDH